MVASSSCSSVSYTQAAAIKAASPREVDWDRLDKTRFFVSSIAVFSSISACLFPLSVIKTKVMVERGGKASGARAAGSSSGGLVGTYNVARGLVRSEGIAGLYKGFGTVVLGTIPARVVYLSTLEVMKQHAGKLLVAMDVPEVAVAGGKNLVAGGIASAMTQSIVVPIDVVSQRQMVAPRSSESGIAHIVRGILRNEGVLGLYRGFSISLMTFVPSSALWWGSYGAYTNTIYSLLPDSWSQAGSSVELPVQTVAGCCAGGTSAFLTNPIDVIKTRLQVGRAAAAMEPASSAAVHAASNATIMTTVRELIREEGLPGFMRGVVPRMLSTALWGTAMVTAYEFLKRYSSIPDL